MPTVEEVMEQVAIELKETERVYRQHLQDEYPSIHVNGCFYCGGDHYSGCCPDRQAIQEYWAED